ncbi:MAG: molybdopterin molybdenumtransferase MoeA [Bacteroidetes bacterium]|nr:MAG: molybdopterin molybdenumtransferase MoeA [Bacteroidota bacterium]
MSKILTYEDACEIIKEHFKFIKPAIREVDILDSVGCLLAEDIISDIDMPSFDNSQMDGYAVKFNENIREWDVIGEISAGKFNDIEIRGCLAVSIMTGAKLPTGADTVIPVENVVIESDRIKLKEGIILKKGSDVRFKGEDKKKGAIAIPSDTLIKTNNIPLIASYGYNKIKVIEPLKIGFFATGNELIDINSIPVTDQIRSSNLYTLSTLIQELEMSPVNFGTVRDDEIQIKDTINKAVEYGIDILITTGGVSVGKYDFLKDVIEDCGFEKIFWKVNVKPGKPLLFCLYKNSGRSILYFGLPGNPVSAFISFTMFIKPFIIEMYNQTPQKKFFAKLENDLIKKDDRKTFVRGTSNFNNSTLNTQHSTFNTQLYTVRDAGGGTQSSGDMSSLSNANCLIVFEEEKYKLFAGEIVECIMI